MSDLKPWTSLPNREYVGLPRTDRVLAILDCVALEILGGAHQAHAILRRSNSIAAIEAALADTVVDVSQNPVRRSLSTRAGNARCMVTGSHIYSFRRDAAILPLEKMYLHGHSRSISVPGTMSVRELEELAGMGISLPCLGLLIVAMALATGL